MEGPRDNGARFLQLSRGLEAEADDGNPRSSQLFEGVFALPDRLRQASAAYSALPGMLWPGAVSLRTIVGWIRTVSG